jgi:Holliday junction DNA helicase RuvB
MFLGASGVGKTLLARALAAEYGTGVVAAMGYDDRPQLAQKLASLRLNDFLLIDECHRLGPLEQELICEAIDAGSVPNLAPKPEGGGPDGAARVALQPWTLVLATDQPGRLVDALLKRVTVRVSLDFYPLAELKEVVAALAEKESLLLTPQAARLVAEVSGGLPRRARQLLLNLRLFYPDSEHYQIGQDKVRAFLEAQGIDESGLEPLERRYLLRLAEAGTASLETLALLLGTDAAYLKRQVEAQLVKRGLVQIRLAGRRLTPAGRQWAEAATAAPAGAGGGG